MVLMVWARVDDGWWAHPKVLGLSLAARGLWTTALSWSCAQRRPVVPSPFVAMVTAGDDDPTDELVHAGLWVEVDGGFEIHDWAEYQEKSLSEKRSEAGAKGGKKSRPPKQTGSNPEANGKQTTSKGVTNGEANGEAGIPTRPVPTRPKTKPPASDDASKDRFEQHFWPIYPPTNGVKRNKAEALREFCKLTIDDQRAAVIGARNKAAHYAATGEQPPYAERFLRNRDFEDFLQAPKFDVNGHAKPPAPESCPVCHVPLESHDEDACELAKAGKL